MQIAILVYDKLTALDAIGPYEVLSRLPGAKITFVAEEAGPVTTDTGFLTLAATAGLASVDHADILLIPGGPGEVAVRQDTRVLDWVRAIHKTSTWTTSVCTGSLVLGAAGLLEGLRATTHWAALEALRPYGAEPVSERIVEEGKVITAAGVSAGIDMALHLVSRIAGPEYAQALQLAIEYDPQPPFDAGSPAKAPAPIVDMVRARMTKR